jgi:hypothetical protein
VTFWRKTLIYPNNELAKLHVNAMAHNPDRNPIWKLRLAPDLVIKLQPKPTNGVRFKGNVVMCEGADETAFKSGKWPRGDRFHAKFEVWSVGEDWCFKLGSAGWSVGADRNEIERLRRRLLNAFKPGGPLSRIDIKMMLHPHCLCCGKPLSDPASKARLIGPECAQASRLETKHTIDAM